MDSWSRSLLVILGVLLLAVLNVDGITCQPSPSLWPLPQSIVSQTNTTLTLNPNYLNFNSSVESEILSAAFVRTTQYLLGLLIQTSNPQMKENTVNAEELSTLEGAITTIQLEISNGTEPLGPNTDEKYQIQVGAPVTYIVCQNIFAAMHALTTIQQLATPCDNTLVYYDWVIEDYPVYSHRGLSLDTARNFISLTNMQKIVVGMASAKMNVLHWHISDSQSFPMEVTTPEIKNLTNPTTRTDYYSKADVLNFIKFTTAYGVRLIPEFDMPAHSMSWNKGFPEIVVCAAQIPWSPYADEPPSGQLDPSNPETYTVISALVNEMTQTFPDPYYHIGGDEVNFPCWQTNPNFNTWLQDNNFTLGEALNYFEQKVSTMVEATGKTITVWQDVILQGARFPNKEKTIVQVWDSNLTVYQQMIDAGYNIVISNSDAWYLDCGAGNFVNYGVSWCDPFKTWLDIYQNQIFYTLNATQLKSVLGGEVALWTEQTDDNNVETMIFPRIFGAAEPLWIGFSPNMDYLNVLERLKMQRLRVVQQGIRAVPLQPTYCFVSGPGSCPQN